MLRLLVFMNCTGSFFLILRKILLPFEKNYMPPAYSVFLYRLNLMFFIIPFPACLFYWRRYFDYIISKLPVVPFLFNGSHIIVHFEQNISLALPRLNYLQILFFLLWIAVLIRKYIQFSAKNKQLREMNSVFFIFKDDNLAKGPIDFAKLVDNARKELNIKKEPRVFVHKGMITPHVSGIFHITLCLPSNWDVSEQVYYMAIKHELAHIKNKDLLFQRIASITRIISWFNPLLYLLCKDMEKCEELAADAIACKGASIADIKAYQTAILNLSIKLSKLGNMPIKAFGFKRKKKNFTKERILAMGNKKIFKHKTLKLAATAFMSVVLFSLSTIPALAYTLPPQLESENLDVNSIDMVRVDSLPSENDLKLVSSTRDLETELYSFTDHLDFSKSDWYCIDENGIVYDEQTIEPRIIPCNHSYIPAQISHHKRNSSGGCSIDYYSAKRCTKCGYIVETGHIATTTFDKCPH